MAAVHEQVRLVGIASKLTILPRAAEAKSRGLARYHPHRRREAAEESRLRTNGARYGLVSRGLHWSVALLIIGLLWLGWYMADLSYYDRWSKVSLDWHKAL